jgi:hypothetical protein
MIVPRLPDKLATIRQISTPRFQIAGIANRPKKHIRQGFARVDFSNYQTSVKINIKCSCKLTYKKHCFLGQAIPN